MTCDVSPVAMFSIKIVTEVVMMRMDFCKSTHFHKFHSAKASDAKGSNNLGNYFAENKVIHSLMMKSDGDADLQVIKLNVNTLQAWLGKELFLIPE